VPLPQVAKEAIASRLWATAKNDDKTRKESDKTKEPLLKLSWYAAEMFGKIFAPANNQNSSRQESVNGDDIDLQSPPSSLKEAIKRIELDNARSYFLSGNVDVMAYDTDCIFADPFVSFTGEFLPFIHGEEINFHGTVHNTLRHCTTFSRRLLNSDREAEICR
jgi:hypothetical protein